MTDCMTRDGRYDPQPQSSLGAYALEGWDNTMARGAYERIEGDLTRQPLSFEGIAGSLLRRATSAGPACARSRRRIPDLASILKELVVSHPATIAAAFTTWRPRNYGKTQHYLQYAHFCRDPYEGSLLINDKMLILDHRKRLKLVGQIGDEWNIVLTRHCVDRICSRHPEYEVRSNPVMFQTFLKVAAASALYSFRNRKFGNCIRIPVQGGVFLCGRKGRNIILKTFVGPRQLGNRFDESRVEANENAKFAFGWFRHFADGLRSGVDRHEFRGRTYVVQESDVWLPFVGGLVQLGPRNCGGAGAPAPGRAN